jgi:hypothetical protein
LGIHPEEKKMIFWDDGKGLFSTTTMENTVKALVNSLLLPSETTKNRTLFIQDFAISQIELHASIEKISGERWAIEMVQSEDVIRDANERITGGDLSATFDLIETGFVTGAFGGNLTEGNVLDNELLGLEPANPEDVVREAIMLTHSTN